MDGKPLIEFDLEAIQKMLKVAYDAVPDDPAEYAAWLDNRKETDEVRPAKGFWTAAFKKLKCHYDEELNLRIYRKLRGAVKTSKAAAEVEAKVELTDISYMVMMAECTMDNFTDRYFNLLHKGLIKGGQDA